MLLRCFLIALLVCGLVAGHIHKRKSKSATATASTNSSGSSGGSSSGDPHREFIWFGNKAGIFSQFIQLKIMHFLMQKSRRVLTIAPSYSPHYGDTPIILCDIFVLPDYIRCPTVVKLDPDMQCITHSISLDQILSDKNKICYQGPLPRLGAKSPREAIIRGVDIPLPLRFHSNHTATLQRFKEALGVAVTQAAAPYTVVHWRRGDQLSTRCETKRDTSINCGSAEELVALVRDRTNHSLVYVATNEMSGSSELAVLRDAGFNVSSDVVARLAPSSPPLGVVEAVVVEVELMRDATLFLGWGVTEVNDVVEY